MKKNLVRAVLVASLSVFFAGATFSATPALAADTAKDAGKPTLSRAAAKPLSEAQKAFAAKDWPTMLAKVKEAQALTNLTDFDKYYVNRLFGVAYYSSGDTASALPYFLAAAESTAAPVEDRIALLHDVIQLENAAKNYTKVIEIAKEAEKLGAINSGVAAVVSVAYYDTGDYANAKLYAQKSVDADIAAGKAPDRGAYQVLLMAQNRQKDIPGETKTLEIMCGNYGVAEDWGHLIDLSLGSLQKSTSREVAALYFYRLRLTTGAETTADDYLLIADLALGLHYPSEAKTALQQGIAAGVLSQAAAAGVMNKANASIRSDESTLAAADAIAAKSPSSVQDVSVAEDYYGYGKFADAARVAQRAIPKNGPKALEAQLLLGVVQARLGDNAAAAQSLARVRGDAGLERAAQLWTIYVTRKYGPPAAAAPAGK